MKLWMLPHSPASSVQLGAAAGGAPATVWDSDWGTAIGTANNAITDGALWDGPAGNAVINSDGRTLDVVSAASVGADTGTLTGYLGNVLRMRMRAQCFGQMQAVDMVPASTTHFMRQYIRSDAGRRSQHGSGHLASNVSVYDSWQILAHEHYGGADAASPFQLGIRTGFPSPRGRYLSPELSKATWYRYEVHVEYNPAVSTEVKVWPRIYSVAGTLLYDSDDFTDYDGTATTLTDAYALHGYITLGAPDDAASAAYARNFVIGLEDPSDAGSYDPVTPAYIYVAKFAASTSGWVGE